MEEAEEEVETEVDDDGGRNGVDVIPVRREDGERTRFLVDVVVARTLDCRSAIPKVIHLYIFIYT